MNLRSAEVIDLQEWRAAKAVREAKELRYAEMTLGELMAAVAKIKAENE